jgi:S1-C subfamily serine protease
MLVDGHEVAREVGAIDSQRLQQMFEEAKDVVRRQKGFRGDDKPLEGHQNSRTAPVLPGASPLPDTERTRELDNKLLSCSVRLTLEDAKSRSHGTGTVIDAREGEALIITCGHLFRDSKGKAPVTVELFEMDANGVRMVESVQGSVVSYNLERDVAFVSIRPTHPVCVAVVAPQRTQISRGDRAASVGCSNGEDPTVMATRVTWLDRYQGPPNIETSGAPVIGRSGGGLFNEQGNLVGVCFAADKEGNKGLYAGLQSIHDELSQLGLQELYAKPVVSTPPGSAENDIRPVGDTVVRGQVLGPDAGGNVPAPAALAPTEQAALEEIVSRAATKNVIIYVQPTEPGGQVEVITLENASGEFVEELKRRKKGVQVAAAPQDTTR